MGGKSTQKTTGDRNVYNTATNAYNRTTTPSNTENEFVPISQGMYNNYQNAVGQQGADYGRIMGGYQDFLGNLSKNPIQQVSAQRPAELGESYGYLREAMPGYRNFAETGGYSPQDIQELRARGISPIRAAYGNTMRELDRARALGGSGGAVNYTAALSRAQREQPEQMANAMTNVNAGLANDIRQGKMFGLQGITGTGATMGGLSSQEAERMLRASMANQQADIQGRGLALAGLGGQTSLYGTTPAMANMFGNQALAAYGQRFGAENARNQLGMGYLGLAGQMGERSTEQSQPWYQTLMQGLGSAAPYLGGMFGGKGINPGLGGQGGGQANNQGFYPPGYTGGQDLYNSYPPGYNDPGWIPGEWGGGGYSGWEGEFNQDPYYYPGDWGNGGYEGDWWNTPPNYGVGDFNQNPYWSPYDYGYEGSEFSW